MITNTWRQALLIENFWAVDLNTLLSLSLIAIGLLAGKKEEKEDLFWIILRIEAFVWVDQYHYRYQGPFSLNSFKAALLFEINSMDIYGEKMGLRVSHLFSFTKHYV